MKRPKRPNSYNFFQSSVYPQCKKDFPELKNQELTKKCGEMWRNLADKGKWIAMAAVGMKKYEEDMIEFKRQEVEAKKVQKESSKKSKASDKSLKSKLKSRQVVHQASLLSFPRICLRRIDDTLDQDSDTSAPVDDATKFPVFNDNFLTHNKAAEVELRTLRTGLTDAQLEEAGLIMYNEKLETNIRKLEDSTHAIQHKIEQMEHYLALLKAKIVVDLKIQSCSSTDDIANFIKDLSSEEKLRKEPETVQQARNVLDKIKFN